MRTPGPVPLRGHGVALEPLTADHLDALLAAGGPDADEVFRWTGAWWPPMRSLEDARSGLERALTDAARGTRVPWAIVDGRGEVAGSTSVLNVSLPDDRLEVGATWLGRRWWGTGLNVATKRLLLAHAFEELGARRVELRTDAANARARRAITALGAVEEGTLRAHVRRPDGTWRDTVVTAVLAEDWPAVRTRLDGRLVGTDA